MRWAVGGALGKPRCSVAGLPAIREAWVTPHYVSVARSMAAGREIKAALGEVGRRLSVLQASHDHMEEEEAVADATAFKAENRMKRLGHMNETDEDQFEEARLWLASVSQNGAADIHADSHRAESARWMLGVIHCRTLKICAEAPSLHEKREHFCEREFVCEAAGDELAAAIDWVQRDLEAAVAADLQGS